MNTETLKDSIPYVESDSLAVIRGPDNVLSWLPVYLDPDNNCFVKQDGAWLSVNGLKGFQRFERQRTKRLYNTATGKLVSAW